MKTAQYAGLTEAVWTVIRLGRGVDIATAAPDPDYSHTPTDATRRHAVESASGLRLRRPEPHTSADGHHESDSPAVRAEHRPGDRFDLIITAVHPHDTDWLTHTDWTTIRTSTGTIAAVTHGDSSGGRLVDPLPTIAGTFRSQGWRWLDHVAVLTEHLYTPTSATTAMTPVVVPVPAPAAVAAAERLPIRSVHHDLLLFVAALPEDLPDTAAPGEASDE